MKIKDLYLSLLSENADDFFYLDESTINKVKDISLSKDENYVRIDFSTTYDKNMSVVVNYDDFVKWYSKNKEKGVEPEAIFKKYLQQFIATSSEADTSMENVNEIVDDNGDIMDSTDLPSNSTGRMVGDKIRWDLERVYQSSIPKSIRFYSGDLGIGYISW